MGERYRQLSLEDRYAIARLREAGRSLRQIAAALDRSPSSISRELKRNTGAQLGYRPGYAEQQACARRWTGMRLERDDDLRTAVLDRLAAGWSPEQIAGRMALDAGQAVISHESIYRFIYAQIRRTHDGSWRHYLPRAKAKRGRRGRKGGSPALHIKGRVPIAQRGNPDRAIPGHWEGDTMLFAAYGQVVLAAHERSSRAILIARPPSKQAAPIADQLARWLAPLPPTSDARSASIMEPSSPNISACNATESPPTSAMSARPGRKAASKMPSAASAASCPAKPTSTPSQNSSSKPPLAPTTIPRENASASKHQPKPSTCCTSNVNPPSRLRGNDGGSKSAPRQSRVVGRRSSRRRPI
jgi:IS30 family transposase